MWTRVSAPDALTDGAGAARDDERDERHVDGRARRTTHDDTGVEVWRRDARGDGGASARAFDFIGGAHCVGIKTRRMAEACVLDGCSSRCGDRARCVGVRGTTSWVSWS